MSIHVNGHEISSRAINIESAHHQEPGADPRLAQRRAAVALTVRELLRQRAEQRGIDTGDDDSALDAAIDALIADEVAVPEADEAACRQWYESNPERFRTPDVAEVRHILLAAAPDDIAGRDAARDLAESLIAALRDQDDDFAVLARRHSRCPSAREGGHLGQISRGQTVPEFEDTVLRAPLGLMPRALESRYGFHVVEVLQSLPGEPLPFETVRPRIAEYLEDNARQRAVSQYMRLLAGEASIQGIDLDAAESALIQ